MSEAPTAKKTPRYKTGRHKHSEETVIAAIHGIGPWLGDDGEPRGSNGLISLICKRLGINPRTFYDYRVKRPAIAQAYEDERERTLDLAEQSLLGLVLKQDFRAVNFYLKCQGKERGYAEKPAATAAPEESGPPPALLVLPENFADAAAWEAFIKRRNIRLKDAKPKDGNSFRAQNGRYAAWQPGEPGQSGQQGQPEEAV